MDNRQWAREHKSAIWHRFANGQYQPAVCGTTIPGSPYCSSDLVGVSGVVCLECAASLCTWGKSDTSALNLDEMNRQAARVFLQQSKAARQQAVAKFPLRVAEIALQMSRLIEYHMAGVQCSTPGVEGSSIESTIDCLERVICQEFVSLFGHDMVGAE